MGLLDLIVPGGSAMFDAVRGTTTGMFSGMAGAGSDPRAALTGATQGMQEGQQRDDAFGLIQRKEQAEQQKLAQEAQRQNATIQWLQENAPEYAGAVQAGVLDPAKAYEMSLGGGGDPFTLSPGEVRFGPDGQPIASAPAAQDDPTSDIQNYEYYKQQELAAGRPPLPMFEWQQQKAKAGATNIDFNQNQGVAAGFADRMVASEQILSDPAIVKAMTDPVEQGKGSVPFGVGNFIVSKEYQMAEQAKRDFINSILRRESGAVISPSEFENAAQQYFPQPGDSPEVIAQKKRNRDIALAGIQRAAGPNYNPATLSPAGVVDPYEKYGLETP